MVHCDRRHSSSTLSHLNRERERERRESERERIIVSIRLYLCELSFDVGYYFRFRGPVTVSSSPIVL